MSKVGYDIIGDVHGCAFTLEKLLDRLGYQHKTNSKGAKTYWHPTRRAIFVGDIVDRGPNIREALHLIKNMTDAGSAFCVMGNHEYNALAYTTKAPENSGRAYVREHTQRHNRLIAKTLSQFATYPEEWRMFLDWFQTLPVFLEFENFRVVHACWDADLINTFLAEYKSHRVTKEFIRESWDDFSFAGRFMDRLTRGTTLDLPEGRKILSRDGYERRAFRTKFWTHTPETYEDIVFQPDPLPDDLLGQSLSKQEYSQLLNYHADEVPVFIGHYWLQGTPMPLKPNVACLDYSAVKYGRLVAYRFDGEQQLSPEKFQWVYVDPK